MMDILEGWALPPTFPREMVPEFVQQFVRVSLAERPTLEQLKEMVADFGFIEPPICKPLPHVGVGVYGFSLSWEGLEVPLMVRFKEVSDGPHT